jgi:hypothetical protein
MVGRNERPRLHQGLRNHDVLLQRDLSLHAFLFVRPRLMLTWL